MSTERTDESTHDSGEPEQHRGSDRPRGTDETDHDTGHDTRRNADHDPAGEAPPSGRTDTVRRVGRWTVLRRAWAHAKRDRLPLVSAGVAFYAFLSIIPTLIAVVMVYGLVSDPDEVTQQVQEYAGALPEGAQELLIGQLEAVAGGTQQSLGIGLAIALAVALWSASAGMSNLITAVNLAYEGEESRGFVKSKALALVLTLGAIVFFIVAIALVAAMPAAVDALELPGWADPVVEAARWVVLLLAVITALGVLYRWAPERRSPGFRWLTFGAVLATLLWIAASAGFAIYVDTFGNYAETYGSLAGVIVLLLWLWIGAFAALFGAEVNARSEEAAEPAAS